MALDGDYGKLRNFGLSNNVNNFGLNETQKKQEVKSNVPIGETKSAEYKDFGDKLLTETNFYSGMGLNLSTKNIKPGSLADLEQKCKTLNASKADRADKLTAYNAFEGNDWSSWLTKAKMYGNLSYNTEDYLINSTNMRKLNNMTELV